MSVLGAPVAVANCITSATGRFHNRGDLFIFRFFFFCFFLEDSCKHARFPFILAFCDIYIYICIHISINVGNPTDPTVNLPFGDGIYSIYRPFMVFLLVY